MFNNIPLLAVIGSLFGTVIVLFWINRRSTASEKLRISQEEAIIKTIRESRPVLKELKKKIAEMESLSRDSAKTPQIRVTANEARNLVTHLDDLIVVQNLEQGLTIRQDYEKETAQ